MTLEERREKQLDAIGCRRSELDYRQLTVSPVNALDRLLSYLDKHQPLTAKLLREGDPEGPVADAMTYGLTKHSCSKGYTSLEVRLSRCYDINYPEDQ